MRKAFSISLRQGNPLSKTTLRFLPGEPSAVDPQFRWMSISPWNEYGRFWLINLIPSICVPSLEVALQRTPMPWHYPNWWVQCHLRSGRSRLKGVWGCWLKINQMKWERSGSLGETQPRSVEALKIPCLLWLEMLDRRRKIELLTD